MPGKLASFTTVARFPSIPLFFGPDLDRACISARCCCTSKLDRSAFFASRTFMMASRSLWARSPATVFARVFARGFWEQCLLTSFRRSGKLERVTRFFFDKCSTKLFVPQK